MPNSSSASNAFKLVSSLQKRFVKRLEKASNDLDQPCVFQETSWLRDEGRHGGGNRFVAPISLNQSIFNRASVNVSQIHYNDDPAKKLSSATALSTIIHPVNPYAPSVHMHISWTEMKDGNGYWRMMADLNPAIPNKEQTVQFQDSLREVTLDHYTAAASQGDRYFYIPALGRHRGVSHFYLENFNTGGDESDRKMAQRLGETVIELYAKILEESIEAHPHISSTEEDVQLDYHTLYFFQVLTLDRGTTSGLLVHDQNDLGIMGSLPSHVNKPLLKSWVEKLPSPQDQLLENLLAALGEGDTPSVTDDVKRSVAQVVRSHYKKHPEALSLQASGEVIPPTVKNHQ